METWNSEKKNIILDVAFAIVKIWYIYAVTKLMFQGAHQSSFVTAIATCFNASFLLLQKITFHNISVKWPALDFWIFFISIPVLELVIHSKCMIPWSTWGGRKPRLSLLIIVVCVKRWLFPKVSFPMFHHIKKRESVYEHVRCPYFNVMIFENADVFECRLFLEKWTFFFLVEKRRHLVAPNKHLNK